jgi:mono/diheme cytochrome c family protein
MKKIALATAIFFSSVGLLNTGAAHEAGVTAPSGKVTNIGAAPPLVTPSAAALNGAADNFKWYCIQCHGPRGDGRGVNNHPAAKLPVSPRNLTDGKDMAQFSDEDMFRTITRGGGANDLSAIMPPWGNVFSESEIRALVGHVRKLCKCLFDPRAKELASREDGLVPEEKEKSTGRDQKLSTPKPPTPKPPNQKTAAEESSIQKTSIKKPGAEKTAPQNTVTENPVVKKDPSR